MAIHVKELVIKAQVGLETHGATSGGGDQGVSQAAVVKAAVEEVMRVMKDKKNR
jgi:hypothetical protein